VNFWTGVALGLGARAGDGIFQRRGPDGLDVRPRDQSKAKASRMATVKGRRWPTGVPGFASALIDGATGKPAVKEGKECVSRPGDFRFQDIDAGDTVDPRKADTLDFVCPRSGKYCGFIAIGYPDKPASTPSWQWDGNLESPTLKPSINCISGCGWHGYLTNGEWKDA
jgi:hypothetical protein